MPAHIHGAKHVFDRPSAVKRIRRLHPRAQKRVRAILAGLDTLDGEPELPVRKLLHRAQDGGCLAELPGFNIAQLRLSYRELEQLAAKKGWTLQKL